MRRGKVLVIGAAEAGKSTLIQALAPGAMNLEVDGRTVAMDHAVLSRRGSIVSLVGVPGQRRFGPVREVLAKGAVCAVWVHRADTPVDRDTAELIAKFSDEGLPYVVFVNRDDGCGREDGWRTPADCRGPAAVIAGNPLKPDGCLASLEDEVWKLVD